MKRGRQLIEDIASLPSVKKSGSKLSCSIGAAVYPADGSTYEQLFLKADMALYAGKTGVRAAALFTIHPKACG